MRLVRWCRDCQVDHRRHLQVNTVCLRSFLPIQDRLERVRNRLVSSEVVRKSKGQGWHNRIRLQSRSYLSSLKRNLFWFHTCNRPYQVQGEQKSVRSNPSGNCVEMAELPSGEIAMRNSRHPDGPALVYTRAEIEAFINGAKDGDFDDLIGPESRND